MGFFTEDGKKKPISGRRGVSAGVNGNKENSARDKALKRRKRQTIRSLNYHGNDYTGPFPSRRSIKLDRARKSKQPWEQR